MILPKDFERYFRERWRDEDVAALVLPPETPRGIIQVGYQGHRLGLMKNLGTRANNLYPKEWRIRSSFITPHTLF